MEIISEGPTRRNVFKEVARLRCKEAAILLREDEQLGAVYLLGYSIECYLKYIVCERQEWDRLPDEVRFSPGSKEMSLYTHDWSRLVAAAGILSSIEEQHDVHVRYLWLCEQWGPSLRYRTARFRGREGLNLYNDLGQLYLFLKELIP